MTVSILVATPHAPFGELLRMSLEESGQYQVRLVQSGKEARSAASHLVFQLAIMDSSLTDEPFAPLCKDLLKAQTGLRLMVIPPENNPNHPALGGLMPHGYLARPFYLPDLIQTVARLLGERERELRQHGNLPAAAALSATLPPWLQEPMALSAYLEQELGGTEALAGVIGLNGPQPGTGVLRAAAGAIKSDAAEELCQTVLRYWNRGEKTDLMRFLRLTADKRDYLVYATQIAGDLVLVLAYDNAAPLSQIRPQSKDIAQKLASLPPDGYHAARLNPGEAASAAQEDPAAQEEPAAQEDPALKETAGAAAKDQPRVSASNEPATQPIKESTFYTRAQLASQAEEDNQLDEEDCNEETLVINLSALLGAVPSPDPDSPPNGEVASLADETARENFWSRNSLPGVELPPLVRRTNGWERGDSTESKPAGQEEPQSPSQPEADSDGAAQDRESVVDIWPFRDQQTVRLAGRQVAQHTGDQPSERVPADLSEAERALEEYAPAEVPEGSPEAEFMGDESAVPGHLMPPAGVPTPDLAHLPALLNQTFPIPDPPGDPLEDTNPGVITTVSQINQLEPASPAISLLNYTCVLVPRLPQHFLTGELADRLAQWLAQLCLAYGWRLEGIAVRPEYVQWSVQVAPAVSPGNLVRIVRQRTSFYIFNAFAHLVTDNPSGDFWATGYLIVSGPQPPSAQLLRDYIAQTRKRQGLGRT